jgi:DHA1 family inner membrane transport protein
MTLTYLLMSFLSFQPIIMAILVLIWGSMAFAFGAPVQTRILNNARDAPTLAANLIPSAFNVSIAGGAWLGGTLIDAGFSYAILPWIGVVSAGLAALVAIASWMNERRAA